MSRSTRLLQLLRPYTPLFIVNLATTFVASVLDGVTFVLLIPFLRTLFGQEALPATGGSTVERLLAAGGGRPARAGGPRAGVGQRALGGPGPLLGDDRLRDAA